MLGMTTRNPTPELSDAERLRERMVLPPTLNLLRLAETSFSKLRGDQRAAKAKLEPLYAELRKNSTPALKAQIAETEAEAAALDEPMRQAFVERDRRREQAGEKARADLGPAVQDFVDTVSRKLDDLEEVLRIGTDLHTQATLANIELHSVVGRSVSMLQQVYALRRLLRGGF